MLELLQQLPEDPILGLGQAFAADTHPLKVDLGVGVYKDEQGNTPIMSAVQQAQALWSQCEQSKSYLSPEGIAGFNTGVSALLLGKNHTALETQRVTCVQTPGGCGANRLAAELVKRCRPDAKIWLPTPSWLNHFPLISGAGLQIAEYPYYNSETCAIDFTAMVEELKKARPGDVVLLHGCCHNPTGADLSRQQWQTIATEFKQRQLIPFIDIAYQGLADDLDDDAWGARHLATELDEVFLVYSCSKNFGLYRERVGAALVISPNPQLAHVCRGQLIAIARSMYSMSPSHGAAIADIILNTPTLREDWRTELAGMRARIQQLRQTFYQQTQTAGMGDRFHFITQQKGLFSLLGLTPQQVRQLKCDYSIYIVASGRINIAGLNQNNIPYVIDALNTLYNPVSP